jgi:hypothetical protein
VLPIVEYGLDPFDYAIDGAIESLFDFAIDGVVKIFHPRFRDDFGRWNWR